MKVWSRGALSAVAMAVAATGCQSVAGAAAEPVSLADGLVTLAPPRGFETTIQPPQAGSTSRSVTFRGPARRRGNFNNCTVRAVAVAPGENGRPVGELAAAAARRLHADNQTTDGLHDLSLNEPAPDRANGPWVVRSSFTIDYTLRMSERYWGVSSAGRDYLIVQRCGTGGSAEELAAIEELTRPLFAAQ